MIQAGESTSIQTARHWRALPHGRVRCDLCYRRCVLVEGQAGWCKARRNAGGRVVLAEYGAVVLMGLILRKCGALRHWRAGAVCLTPRTPRCTARCDFCAFHDLAVQPDRLPLRSDWWGKGWRSTDPAQVVAMLDTLDIHDLNLDGSEPTLTLEYSLTLAQLAKQRGRHVSLYTNGLASPAVVRELAPSVDAVAVGFKGSADEGFLSRVMHTAGARSAILASCAAWRATGVELACSDLVPTTNMEPNDERVAEAQRRLYGWLAEHVGDMTHLTIAPVLDPPTGIELDGEHAQERVCRAIEIARAEGMRYANIPAFITCHACGKALLIFCVDPDHDDELHVYPQQYATDGRCDWCGARVPVHFLPPSQVAAEYRKWLALVCGEVNPAFPWLSE